MAISLFGEGVETDADRAWNSLPAQTEGADTCGERRRVQSIEGARSTPAAREEAPLDSVSGLRQALEALLGFGSSER